MAQAHEHKLRVAVVGAGHLGQHHARVYAEMGDTVELVGVCDIDPARARQIANRHDVPAYTEAEALLGRVDAVSIATPTESHYEVGRLFLEAGVAALIEKPLARTLEEAQALCRAARASGAALQVGHIERFNPALVACRRHLHDPRFISCDRVTPFSFRSADIGVVLDLMIHDLDVVLHLARGPVAEVEAMGVPVLTAHEDIAHARLRFEDGATAVLTASRVSVKRLRKIRVFQPDCYISLDYGERQAAIFRRRPGFRPGADLFAELDPRGMDPAALQALVFSRFIEVEHVSMEDAEPLKLELQSFVQAVRTGTEPEVPGAAGLRAMEVADRIQAALLAQLERERARAASRAAPGAETA
ncbi:MAG: UDP-N-acetylglucosamine 3-dehydrogenase [Planctomycetota bacterium]|nr:MAG: UDP-N-acetylglucosamine 3-dehydrogenase [Planctomycetota bacterium]